MCVCEDERERKREVEGRRHAEGRGVLEKGQRCSAGSNVMEETTGAHTLPHTLTHHCCTNIIPSQERRG